jgi:hypothetical protein
LNTHIHKTLHARFCVLVEQDFRFQFMNTVRVAEKPLNLTFIHGRNDNRTILDGTLVLDSANKLSANHVLGSRNGKLKYTYVHGGVNTFEPTYDLAKNSWDFALSRRVYGDDVLRASYQTSSQVLGLEWARNSKYNGAFKVYMNSCFCIWNWMFKVACVLIYRSAFQLLISVL